MIPQSILAGPKHGIKLKVARYLWRKIYGRFLDEGDEVLAVIGWRSARIRTKTKNIKCITPCFWWFK